MTAELSTSLNQMHRFFEVAWPDLDCIQNDDRLTRAEIDLARHWYLSQGKEVWAAILTDALIHYDAMCLAHTEADSIQCEIEIGISKQDLSSYLKQLQDYHAMERFPEGFLDWIDTNDQRS